MTLTVVVTNNVQGRYRGFLGSMMLELAAGVYVSPRMTKGVRERMWNVISSWYSELGQGAVTLIWRDRSRPGGISVKQLGNAPKELVETDGLLLARRGLSSRTKQNSL